MRIRRLVVQLLALCLAAAFATSLSGSARADVDRNSPLVGDNDPRLLGTYRASGRYITTTPCQKLPCEAPRPSSPGTREVPPLTVVAPSNGAPSLVTRIKNALERPPTPAAALMRLPFDIQKGLVLEGWDIVKDTAELATNNERTAGRVGVALLTGNVGAVNRAVNDWLPVRMTKTTVQLVKTTVKGVTTGTRMVSAAVTGNDQALMRATLESRMFPVVVQASVEGTRIVNTIRNGTPEERAQLISQGGEFSGRLTLEAALFAVPGGAEIRTPSLAAKTARLTTRAEEKLVNTGRRMSNAVAVRRYGPRHWKVIEAELEQLMASSPANIAGRQKLMSDLSEKMNIPSLAENSRLCPRVNGGVGGGNCAFSALNSLETFAYGHPASPLTYPPGSAFRARPINGVQLLADRGWLSTTMSKQPVDGVRSFLGKNMRDGQMGLLDSWSGFSGHTTVIVRMGDEFYIVNNQRWAPGPRLQTLSEWDQTWRKHATDPSSVHYDVAVSPLTVGGK